MNGTIPDLSGARYTIGGQSPAPLGFVTYDSDSGHQNAPGDGRGRAGGAAAAGPGREGAAPTAANATAARGRGAAPNPAAQAWALNDEAHDAHRLSACEQGSGADGILSCVHSVVVQPGAPVEGPDGRTRVEPAEIPRMSDTAPLPASPTFSIVIPVYNEAQSLPELLASIEQATQPSSDSYEVVCVDDGSTDRSLEVLKALARTHKPLRVFSFRRNLGKSRALLCGFQKARGRYVLTMDADLQDDPANLPRMYDQLIADGADIVSGWRKERRDRALKIAVSRVFNRLMVRLLFGSSFQDINSGLKLYDADVARELHLYGGMHRFIPVIATEMGYRVTECPVRHNQRKYGTSKYSSLKFLTEMPDLLTIFFVIKYTSRPLHFFARVGSALVALGVACLLYLTILWTQSIPIGTRPLLMLGVLLVVVGGQTVFAGLLADLIVNVTQSKRQEFPLKYTSDAAPRTPI